jgi:hypothetical protein
VATSSGTYAPAGPNDQIMALNPSLFVNASNHDYRLAMPTVAGVRLGPPFDRDLLNRARDADGVWDRGAFEYVEGGTSPDTTPPARPTGLRIVN